MDDALYQYLLQKSTSQNLPKGPVVPAPYDFDKDAIYQYLFKKYDKSGKPIPLVNNPVSAQPSSLIDIPPSAPREQGPLGGSHIPQDTEQPARGGSYVPRGIEPQDAPSGSFVPRGVDVPPGLLGGMHNPPPGLDAASMPDASSASAAAAAAEEEAKKVEEAKKRSPDSLLSYAAGPRFSDALPLMNLFAKSAAQAGSLGGKTANTEPIDTATKQMIGQDSEGLLAKVASSKASTDPRLLRYYEEMAETNPNSPQSERMRQMVSYVLPDLAQSPNFKTLSAKAIKDAFPIISKRLSTGELGARDIKEYEYIDPETGEMKKGLRYGSERVKSANDPVVKLKPEAKPEKIEKQKYFDDKGNERLGKVVGGNLVKDLVNDEITDPVARKFNSPEAHWKRQEEEDKRAQKRNEALDKKITKFQSDTEDYNKILTNIKNVESKLGFKLEEYDPKTGTAKNKKVDLPGVNVPGIGRISAYSGAGRDLNSAMAGVYNIELKQRSGTAVTDQELRRLKTEFGTGQVNTEADMIRALQSYKQKAKEGLKREEAGYAPDVIQEYRDRGGVTLYDYDQRMGSTGPQKKLPSETVEQKKKRLQQLRQKYNAPR